MKKLLLFATLLLILFSFATCSNHEYDGGDWGEIMIRETEFKLEDTAGSEADIVFSISSDWIINVHYESSDKGWLTLSNERGGAGSHQHIIVKASANTTTKIRAAKIYFRAGDNIESVNITQTIDPETDITAFFDPRFAKLLEEKLYINDKQNITSRNIREINSLWINSETTEVTSVTGIEYFESLNSFISYDSKIASVDFSNNIKLTYVAITNNVLTSIDVSKNKKLETLYCSSNNISRLDISNNTELKNLNCSNNTLTEINLSKNSQLINLACEKNNLVGIDLRNNTKLKELYCFDNSLTNIDLAKNTELQKLDCSNNSFTNIDLSKNIELQELDCPNNKLTKLDIKGNKNLKKLNLFNNLLTGLDISNNQYISYISYHRNPGKNGKFIIKAWFDNENKPFFFSPGYDQDSWTWQGKRIAVDFQKVK